jgi:hypothetical protein
VLANIAGEGKTVALADVVQPLATSNTSFWPDAQLVELLRQGDIVVQRQWGLRRK